MASKGHFASCVGAPDCSCEEKSDWIALSLTFLVFAIEFIGSRYSGSLALSSDAFHVLSDALPFVVAIVVARRVKKLGKDLVEINKLRSVGGYINAALLGLVALWIFYESYWRLFEPGEIFTSTMMCAALLGMTINLAQHRILGKGSGAHAHAMHMSLDIHVLSDMLQSFMVVVAGLLIQLTRKTIIDPILSALVALLMIFQMFRLFAASGRQAHDHEHGHTD